MPMKFDMSRPLFGLNEQRLTINGRDADGNETINEASLWAVCKFVLLEVNDVDTDRPDAQGRPTPKILTGEDKFKRFKLAEKLQEGGVMELEDDERALIRRLVGIGFNAEAVGVIWNLLDNPLSLVDDGDASEA